APVLLNGLAGPADHLKHVSATQPDPRRRHARRLAESRIEVTESMAAASRVGQGDTERGLDIRLALAAHGGGRGERDAEATERPRNVASFPGRDAERLRRIRARVRVAC